jgi:hypothetical protein
VFGIPQPLWHFIVSNSQHAMQPAYSTINSYFCIELNQSIMSLFSKLFRGNKPAAGSGAGRAQEFLTRIQKDLNLSQEQVGKVQEAIREFMQEKKQLKQSGGSKEEMRESKQDFKQDMLQILNADQQQAFLANMQEYKQLLKGR